MSNEEILEEMYFIAHYNGVFEDFRNEVNENQEKNPNVRLIQIVHDTFDKYVKCGLIK